MCLEDSFVRIQNRLYEITDEPTERLHFVIISESIGNGLEEQIEDFKKEHSDLKVVFIDTLQKVRNESESNYGSDYKELSILKSLAEKLSITIVVVHHTRKCSDSDPFNMISGSTGLSGCVDGSMVLAETKRGSRTAKLHCVGRDIENAEINLQFDSDFKKWVVTDEPSGSKSKDNIFLVALYVYLKEHISSASQDFPTFGAPAKIYRPCAIKLSTTNSIGLYTVVMISSQDFELNFFILSSLLLFFISLLRRKQENFAALV